MIDRCFTVVIWLMAAIVLFVFGWLVSEVVMQGASKLSWQFLTEDPARSGREGGIYPIIVSTLLILATALVIVIPLGLGSAIWLAEFTKKSSRRVRTTRLILDVLAGVPSIVFGLFGYAFFCGFLGLGFSILSGALTLACMMLPILIRTTEAGLTAVPQEWRKAGAALGISRTTLLWQVLLPYASPAITAGLLLSIGRATAETAALIFTSGYVDRMPESLNDSGRALAVHIYDLSMNVVGGDKAAYGSALVLIIMVVIINLTANALSEFWLEKKINRLL
ncbi:phosphate ABC transporter, permease protein PstA [Gammaproteobacteria bacterium 42_54_T18]|nr:phosphate ABC transporter, permease protein PstA [Gammaproteobacteria bacterium 42_54_T18]